MRYALAALACAGVLCLSAAVRAESRMFIIVNNADDYGVDRCLASGAPCGNAVATAYCRAQSYSRAVSFQKVVREDITGTIPATLTASCSGVCSEFVAIECSR